MDDKTKALLLDLKEVLKKHNACIASDSNENCINGESWIDISIYDERNIIVGGLEGIGDISGRGRIDSLSDRDIDDILNSHAKH